jgi:hypothetical protein
MTLTISPIGPTRYPSGAASRASQESSTGLSGFKIELGAADDGDVENDHHVAESAMTDAVVAPSLPPRPEPPPADVWNGVEAEPEHLHHHAHASGHTPIFLLPTAVARLLATIGWLGGVLATVLMLVALEPTFQKGETRNFRLPLDEGAWFGATLIVSGALTYLGWLWWTLSAAFNARRLAPLSTSPWLPTSVYLIGPLIVLAGLEADSEYVGLIVAGGCAWIGVGHLIVVASLKGTAGRIGASMTEFSKLLWLPLAWVAYRMFVNTMLTFVDGEWRSAGLFIALGGISGLFLLGLAAATWNATGSFDHSCHRLNTRSLGIELPSVDLVAAAIRQRALEGR